MARTYETSLEELQDTREEFALLEAMTEAEACYRYNTDSKAEILRILLEEIESLEREVEYLMSEEDYEPAYY